MNINEYNKKYNITINKYNENIKSVKSKKDIEKEATAKKENKALYNENVQRKDIEIYDKKTVKIFNVLYSIQQMNVNGEQKTVFVKTNQR